MTTSNHDSSILFYVPDSASTSAPQIPQIDLITRDLEPLPELGDQAKPDSTLPNAPMPRNDHTHARHVLDGNVLLCPCPECGAPMTFRIWLSTADCWQCDISIALSFEQLRSRMQSTMAPKLPFPAQDRLPPREHLPAAQTASRKHSGRSSEAASVTSTAALQKTVTSSRARRTKHYRAARRQRPWWRSFRAWMVSAIAHLITLALLAMIILDASHQDPFIVLSTEIRPFRHAGDPQDVLEPLNEVEFDLPVPADNQEKREALLHADQMARELRIDPTAADVQLPQLKQVKSMIAKNASRRAMLAARDPRIRVEMIRHEGGTTLTEAAVAQGLRWMSEHQNQDGSWSLEQFNQCPSCQGKCGAQGKIHSDVAGTSLVLLPFLGAGQTHLVGRYQDVVALGLRWLIDCQKSDGDLRAESAPNAGMYAHGQATIVLCEAYAMTGDEQLRGPAQKATDFIVAAQHEAGGWRYAPGQPGDTSVLGWQLMALQSARAAELSIPDYAFENASHFLDSVQHDDGARYAYQRGDGSTPAMTAEALLCRMYLGWDLQHPGLRNGVDLLVRNHLPRSEEPNFYYWYYATQVMHHAGGSLWKQWNHHIRNVLVASQKKRGHEAGSWSPSNTHDQAGGRIYTTALATCTLEVYYRHVPIFHQIQLD